MADTPFFTRSVQFGIAMPHVVVEPTHNAFASTFLRIVHAASPPDAPITRDELLYISNNMRIVLMSPVQCFCDEVQQFEFPSLIRIPTSSIGDNGDKEIIVVMCHFVLAPSGMVDCYFYGFQYSDDLGLRAHAPTGDDVFVEPTTFRSVFDLVSSTRERRHRVDDLLRPTTSQCAPSSPCNDAQALTSSVNVLLSSNQTAHERRTEPGAYIFCNIDAARDALASRHVSREQVVGRVTARLWHYKAAPGMTTSTERRLGTVFSGACANDMCHEFFVALTLTCVFKQNADSFVARELALMQLRIDQKLTDHPTRRKFLELNGLLDEYTSHQATCTHDKHACFAQFVLETYKTTLSRIARIVDYLMYGMATERARPSDQEMIELLTLFVEQTTTYIERQMK